MLFSTNGVRPAGGSTLLHYGTGLHSREMSRAGLLRTQLRAGAHHDGRRQAQTLQLGPVLLHLGVLHLPPLAAEQVDVQRQPPRGLHVPAHHQAVGAGGAEKGPRQVEPASVHQEGEGAVVPREAVSPKRLTCV